MNMVEVKTAELIWPALDWAVAEAEGIQRFVMGNGWPGNSVVADAADKDRVIICNLIGQLVVARGGWSNGWSPSTDWSQGGPLIEREGTFRIIGPKYKGTTDYVARLPDGLDWYEVTGPTPLIAAMRCLVASKLGNTVQVPKELVSVPEELVQQLVECDHCPTSGGCVGVCMKAQQPTEAASHEQ